MKRLVLFLLFLAAAFGLATASGCSTADMEAGLVLGDLTAGSGPSTLKRLTGRPQREGVSWTVDGRKNSGDLYLPAEKAKVGLVLVPGAAKEGKDDPRLVALAQSLARARFLVLVPDMASVRAQEVSAADRLPIADAIRFLDTERRVPGLGIAAISYADVPAILAALDEPKVDFVVSVGGLYDLTAVITFFTTGHYRDGPGQPWRQATPNAYGKWVFVKANARRLDDSGDRALLSAIAERKMADLAAPVIDLTAKLGPQGKSVMALLANDDPAKVPALIAALPPRIKGEIRDMDLAPRDLSQLKAKLFLIHGRDDRIIPWTESAALARMAPQAELTLLDNLAHADLKPGNVVDSYALWRVVGHLLVQRDQLADRRP
ncbi:MAG: alpha/beta hydrolase [Rhodospirillaceae bacterium]|nr:alpha/beta hydrolase [Rhodospirillales bacterium]